MKRRRLTLLTSIIALLVISAALFFEYFQHTHSIDEIIETYSLSLATNVNNEFKTTLELNQEIESLIIDKLNSAAELSNSIFNNSTNINSAQEKFQNILDEFGLHTISILDKNYNLIFSTDSTIISKSPNQDILNDLVHFDHQDIVYLDLGNIINPYTNEEIYAIIRKNSNDNYVLVGLNQEQLLSFRKNFGIGKKINEIATNPDIQYIIIEDESGIYAASSNLSNLNDLILDSADFYYELYNSNGSVVKINYQGNSIIEIRKPFMLDNGEILLSRIAINSQKFNNLQSEFAETMVLAGILTLIIIIVLISFISSQNKLDTITLNNKQINEYLNLLLQNTTDGIIIIDEKEQIVTFNDSASKILGIDANLALNSNYHQMFSADLFGIEKVIATNNSISQTTIKHITPDSEVKYLNFSSNLIKIDNEKRNLIIFLRDETEAFKQQKQLEMREKQTAMSHLASGVAHEIRNPLNAIYIVLQRLMMEFKVENDVDEYQKLTNVMRNEIQKIDQIIKQFLNYSRPTKPDFQSTNLPDIVNELIKLYNVKFLEKNIDIVKNYKSIILTEIDPKKIERLLVNLFDNAIDAMPNGGKLIVHLSQSGNKTEIKITDTGIGIPDDIKSKIFSLYFTTKNNGNGLGLSLVYQIVTEHNGEISFQSNENIGTSFEILLPNNQNV